MPSRRPDMPPDEALPALVALHGSCPGVDRAFGWPSGTLRQYVNRRAALRATCDAYARSPAEMAGTRHGYPDDATMVTLMAEHGTMGALAVAVGVRRESLRDYLAIRPRLRRAVMAAKPASPSKAEREDRRRARNRAYMAARRLTEPNTVRARRRLSMVKPGPGGNRKPTEPELHAYAKILRLDPCAYCVAPSEHIDHIEPVADGGSLEWDNLTPACGPCNRRKRTRPLLMFLLGR